MVVGSSQLETISGAATEPYILPADPGASPRPLWYRLAGSLEPLRPYFAWAVEHERLIKLGGLAGLAVCGALLSLVRLRRPGR